MGTGGTERRLPSRSRMALLDTERTTALPCLPLFSWFPHLGCRATRGPALGWRHVFLLEVFSRTPATAGQETLMVQTAASNGLS